MSVSYTHLDVYKRQNFYKGTIKLTSEVDKGTEFVVRLPVAEAGREENV